MKISPPSFLFSLAVLGLLPSALHATDFKGQVSPVLKQYCYKCHSELQKKVKGKLALDNMTAFATKIGPGAIIKPGNADGSSFFNSMTLPKTDDDHMPPAKEAQPTAAQVAIIKAWINEGASLDGKVTASPAPAPAPGGAPAAQTWKSADGRAIQATFVRLEGENVVIQRADGVVFSVPLANLSPESQAMAKNGGK